MRRRRRPPSGDWFETETRLERRGDLGQARHARWRTSFPTIPAPASGSARPDGAMEVGRRQSASAARPTASTWTTWRPRPITLRDHVGEQIALCLCRSGRTADRRANWPMAWTRPAICAPTWPRSPNGSAPSRDDGGARCSPSARRSSRPGCSPATSPNACALQLAVRDRLDPAMQALVAQSRTAGAARFPDAEADLRRRRGGSARHAGRNPRARPAPGHGVFGRHQRRHRRRCRGARRQRRQLDGRAQSRDAAARAGRPDLFRPGLAGRRRTRRRRISSPNACRTPTG